MPSRSFFLISLALFFLSAYNANEPPRTMFRSRNKMGILNSVFFLLFVCSFSTTTSSLINCVYLNCVEKSYYALCWGWFASFFLLPCAVCWRFVALSSRKMGPLSIFGGRISLAHTEFFRPSSRLSFDFFLMSLFWYSVDVVACANFSPFYFSVVMINIYTKHWLCIGRGRMRYVTSLWDESVAELSQANVQSKQREKRTNSRWCFISFVGKF